MRRCPDQDPKDSLQQVQSWNAEDRLETFVEFTQFQIKNEIVIQVKVRKKIIKLFTKEVVKTREFVVDPQKSSMGT